MTLRQVLLIIAAVLVGFAALAAFGAMRGNAAGLALAGAAVWILAGAA